MAWADLTPEVQEGLNYCANTMKDPQGNLLYTNGRAYMDFVATQNGLEWFARKIADRRAARAAKLEAAQNSALAAQVDALPPV